MNTRVQSWYFQENFNVFNRDLDGVHDQMIGTVACKPLICQ